jgi:hypothetical protein
MRSESLFEFQINPLSTIDMDNKKGNAPLEEKAGFGRPES